MIRSKFVEVFAKNAHMGQYRKYTGEDYVDHCYIVAERYNEYASVFELEVYEAAVLHDTVEDTDVTFPQIVTHFGEKVAEYVWYLTKPESFVGNRAHRKKLDGARLALAPDEVKFIKIIDIMHNAFSIREYDPKLWATWRVEMINLLYTFQAADVWEKMSKESKRDVYPKFIAELIDGL